MKLFKVIQAAMFMGMFLVAPNAFSGVLHPCPNGSVSIEKLMPIEVLSLDGTLAAVLRAEKAVNINCVNIINDYLHIKIDVVNSDNGQTIFPTFLEVLTQIVRADGNVIEELGAQAPSASVGVRLLKGTDSVNILIEGFAPITIKI